MYIDLIVWEDEETKSIAVSATSLAGCRAIAGIFFPELGEGAMMGSAPITEMHPQELMAHLSKDLHIYFYRRALGTMTNLNELGSKHLQ